VHRTETERLISLLHAQRSEDARRTREIRGSAEWTEASSRLDDLNDEIMHLGAYGSAGREPIGDGIELDLDSRPAADRPFRREVIAAVRHALVVTSHEPLALRARDRLAAREGRAEHTRELIRRARQVLRRRYPNASLVADGATVEPDTIAVRADREGRVA
jgi:hypothetical protein